MSGPKVVRVRWLLLESAATLDELALLLGEWSACLRRHGGFTPERLSKGEASLRELQRLHEAGRWRKALNGARAECDSLRREMDAVRSAAIRRAEEAREHRRRLHAAARTISDALTGEGRQIPAELQQVLSRALTATDAELQELRTVVNRSVAGLRPEAPSKVSSVQIDLAERLAASMDEAAAVATPHSSVVDGGRDARLDRLLAEIEAIDEVDVARGFLDRASSIGADPSADRRVVLTDSLILDVAEHVRTRRLAGERRRMLAGARAQLRRISGSAARDLEARVEATLTAERVPDNTELLLTAVKTFTDDEQGRLKATAVRSAVLDALSTLGYEVRESMATALAERGRIVLRKPATAGYGVELGSAPGGERLQLRVVAFAPLGAQQDPARDTDAETIWCSDVDRLRALLAEAGHEAELETALAPGAVPVKTVSDSTVLDEERRQSRPMSKERRL
jgi:hypothetical protein